MSFSRRKFIKNSVGSIGLSTMIGSILTSCSEKNPQKTKNKITSNSTILFQGDSITDADREKKLELPNNASSFGNGYAFLAASSILNSFPRKTLKLYNRGISGNKVYQLSDRWDKDCLKLKPTILSILIGVNDYWHTRDGNYNGTSKTYENDYRKLIERTKKELPNIKIVICQPFILKENSVVDDSWIEPFKEYQISAKKISDEFKTLWAPFQDVFNEAIKHAPAKYWLYDGVHAAMPGAQLMAETWLKTVTY